MTAKYFFESCLQKRQSLAVALERDCLEMFLKFANSHKEIFHFFISVILLMITVWVIVDFSLSQA